MKKTFESANIEVVKLNMPNIIATSIIIGGECATESYDTAKDNNWDED